jgi:hypothetical protein
MRLEFDDRILFERLVALLKDKGKHSQITVGQRLAAIVERAEPLSPAKAVNALVECLNVFYAGRYTFEQHPWTKQQLGSHTQQLAQVELRITQAAPSHEAEKGSRYP